MNKRDSWDARHETEAYHGLWLSPYLDEPTYEQEALDRIIEREYNKCKGSTKEIIGYNGGNTVGGLLEKLGLPCINLDELECPYYEDLPDVWIEKENCGYHRNFRRLRGLPHCALSAVKSFRGWLNDWYVDKDTKTTTALQDKCEG